MLDVHVTSYRQAGLLVLIQSMINAKLVDFGAILSVSYDPRTINPDDFKLYHFVRMIPQPHYVGIPPMFALRAEIHKLGIDRTWMLLDDDDYFVPESLLYLTQCVSFIEGMEEETDRNFFLGTDSHFGSTHHKDRIHISPQNALMPKGKGLMFSKKISFNHPIFAQVMPCLGGLEEHLMCALATMHYDAVPLKRFQNPTKCNIRPLPDRQSSPIHNYDTWKDNSMMIIRRISGDLDWQYPRDMQSKGTKTPLPYIKRAKMLAEKYGL